MFQQEQRSLRTIGHWILMTTSFRSLTASIPTDGLRNQTCNWRPSGLDETSALDTTLQGTVSFSTLQDSFGRAIRNAYRHVDGRKQKCEVDAFAFTQGFLSHPVKLEASSTPRERTSKYCEAALGGEGLGCGHETSGSRRRRVLSTCKDPCSWAQ